MFRVENLIGKILEATCFIREQALFHRAYSVYALYLINFHARRGNDEDRVGNFNRIYAVKAYVRTFTYYYIRHVKLRIVVEFVIDDTKIISRNEINS